MKIDQKLEQECALFLEESNRRKQAIWIDMVKKFV